MDLPDRTQAKAWEGRDVVDVDGQPLGTCVGVFADTDTGVTEWLHVDVEGHVRSFVPALDATESGGAVRVRFARSAVLDAPSVGDQDQLSKKDELELYRHYGVEVSKESDSVLPADVDVSGSTTDPGLSSGTTSTAVAGGAAVGAAGAAVAGGTDDRSADDRLADDRPSDDRDRSADDRLADDRSSDDRVPVEVTSEPVSDDSTGLDLPVLDPAAASVPVPEGQVGDVDEPAHVQDDAAPAAEIPAARLRRVEPAPTLTSAPSYSPPPSSSGGGAAGPLAGVAALTGAVLVVLRAREARRAKRNAPVARADRLRKQLRNGSSAASSLSAAATAAARRAAAQERRAALIAAAKTDRSPKQLAASLSTAGGAASRSGQAASGAVAARTSAVAASLNAAGKAASKAAERRRREAQRDARKQALVSGPKSLASSLSSSSSDASKGLSRRRRKADLKRRKRAVGKSVSSTPSGVGKRARRARRSVGRTLWELVVASAAGGGYVLGAKAGRERYDELTDAASAVAASPQVQTVSASVTDPQRRQQLLTTVRQQVAGLTGRR